MGLCHAAALLLAALDSEFDFEDQQIKLNAHAQVDFAKLFSDCSQTTRCDTTKAIGFFAKVFHGCLLSE